MNWQRLIGKFFASYYIVRGKIHSSFSQAGEDQIIRYLVNDCLQLKQPTYLDIGTNHPFLGNNTYYFYSRGSRGVCVEPDPRYEKLIKRYRRKDIFIRAGVGTTGSVKAQFYLFPEKYSGWNTFSEEEALKRKAETGIDYKIVQQDILNINEIIKHNFSPHPNIISLDVEGLDLSILQSLDFEKYRPEIICVESITFSNSNEQEKIDEISNLVKSKNYFVFADTYVNTIFCKAEAFKKIKR
jgi:FkbM family methyltransferase